MKTLINQPRFLKAVEYASANFFSEPYSISRMVDRWFNQLAMIELTNGTVVHLSGDIAQKYMDIRVDGKLIAKKDIQLIFKFYSRKSDHEKERLAIKDLISDLVADLYLSRDQEINRLKKDQLESAIDKLKQFDTEKQKAYDLYKNIVERGKISLNREQFEEDFKFKIKNIIYRPNHGLGHSVCAAYAITMLQAFYEENNIAYVFDEPELERLQLMMLFSVVGRKDETGFADTDDNMSGNDVYEGFRANSGREFLKYNLEHSKHLYPDLENLYRDAIIVELMGYDDIHDAVYRNKIPEVLIDYVIAKELQIAKAKNSTATEISRENAMWLINTKRYNLRKMFPTEKSIRKTADLMLYMMNKAHGIELTRCYPLFELKEEGPSSIGIFKGYLKNTGFIKNPTHEKLTSYFKLLRCSFDGLKLTGRNSTFGLISTEQFEDKKTKIIQQVKAISAYFNLQGNYDALLKKAKEFNMDRESYFSSDNKGKALVEDYRRFLIQQCVIENVIGILEYRLTLSQVLNFKECASEESLLKFYKEMQSSFDWMFCAGNNTLLIPDAFNLKKVDILAEMNRISDDCKNPDRKDVLVFAAKFAKDDKLSPFTSSAVTDSGLLQDYRNFLIGSYLLKEMTGKDMDETLKTKLNPNNKAFDFQCVIKDDLRTFDHHKNAVKIVQALQTIPPYPGLIHTNLPVIAAVKHDRDINKTTALFDKEAQAIYFKETYEVMFGETVTIANINGQFSIEVDRKNYKQLLNECLIEFKKAELPKKVTREESLVDEEGHIEALIMIKQSQCLARLVSSTALGGESFPDYDYLFNALNNPSHERYSPTPIEIKNYPLTSTLYYDPRNGQSYTRTLVETPLPDIRFQEPITQPVNLKDKIADGWTSNMEKSQPINTIFTKKMAFSLPPDHGKMIPFSGYKHKASNYFPIGILFDRSQMDLKDERYVWTQNMGTSTRFWKRDPSLFIKEIYCLFNAKVSVTGTQLVRDNLGNPLIDVDKIQKGKSEDDLLKFLESQATKLIAKLNERYYHPSDEDLADFKKLVRLQRTAYIKKYYPGNSQTSRKGQRKIIKIYDKLEQRIAEESKVNTDGHRIGAKYTLSIHELIKLQKEKSNAQAHSEILASPTKGALQALYASKDSLFDRLNLAFHAMQIKERYGYDVPLLVFSQDKLPFHYSENRIKNDLLEAYQFLREGNFPYDRTLFTVYEIDDQGNIRRDSKNREIIKKDQQGNEIKIPKNLQAQQDLLVNLFKLGFPALTAIDQFSKIEITTKERDRAVATILKKMNILGGLDREKVLMEKVLAKKNLKLKKDFFCRSAALGHQSLIETMIKDNDFYPSRAFLQKTIEIAQNNGYSDLAYNLLYPISQLLPLKNGKTIAKTYLQHIPRDRQIINNYLLLVELKELDIAQNFLLNQGIVTQEKIHNLHLLCAHYLQEIKNAAWGPQDTRIFDFCKAMEDTIALTKDNYVAMVMHVKQLQMTHKAVTSDEMQEVTKIINIIENSAKESWFFSKGNHIRMANSIKEKIFKIPLKDRLKVLSNIDHPACNDVRLILASEEMNRYLAKAKDLKNQHISHPRDDSTAEFRIKI